MKSRMHQFQFRLVALVLFAILVIAKEPYLASATFIVLLFSEGLFEISDRRQEQRMQELREAKTFFSAFANKVILTYSLIIIVLAVPLVIVFLINGWESLRGSFFNFQIDLDPTYFLSIWLSIVGILVSARVYFELKNKVEGLDEFLRLIKSMMNSAKIEDEIYFLVPTPFLGYYSHRDEFYSASERFFHRHVKSNKFHLCFLPCNVSEIREIAVAKQQFAHMNSERIKQLIDNRGSALLKFHVDNFPKIGEKEEIDYFEGLVEFLNDVVYYPDNSFQLYELKWTENHEYLVLFANARSNDVFIGTVLVNSQTNVEYRGELMNNQELAAHINVIFNQFSIPKEYKM